MPQPVRVLIVLLVSMLLAGSAMARAQDPEVDPAMSEMRDLLYDPGRLKKSGIPSASKNAVHGVVAEIGIEGSVLIVAGFADGTSRLFLGRGGGVIGEKEDFPPETLIAARKLVEAGQAALAQVPRVPTRVWPQQGRVRFALLTSGGVHGADVEIDRLEKGEGPLLPLWDAMNGLLGLLIQFMNKER